MSNMLNPTFEEINRLYGLQIEFAKKVIQRDVITKWDKIAGVDAGYTNGKVIAAAAVLNKRGEILNSNTISTTVKFPYISGLLAFREAEALVTALRDLEFDILMVNGHGIAHPRGCGLASWIGLKIDKPTIGIAKRLLVGKIIETMDGYSQISFDGKIVGMRFVSNNNTMYVSIGHKISIETATDIVKSMTFKESLPRPLLTAHNITRTKLTNEIKID